jgi:hypothetical protein
MAKKAKGEFLFKELHKARYGEGRRSRPLFLPNLLKQETKSIHHEWSNLDQAYEIFQRWADMESAGKLNPRKETTLESEFITQIFGQALGYTLFSENKEEWNLEPKFTANGGIADAAIGIFDQKQQRIPKAVIELKDPTVNVDKDRFNGRTPVQQCWDYLNSLPECPWGIVCNYVSFRLYHHYNTPKIYEIFTLQELRDKDTFKQFYYIFEKQGLISQFGKTPRAEFLLQQTTTRQREVGDELYQYYHDNRQALIARLTKSPYSKSLDDAIRITQKLIDRIVFVAFCEDRELLPENSIGIAWEQLPAFFRVTNPRWQNFLNLFHHIDKGNERNGIPGYNGGLFRQDDDVDNLQLEDEWTDFFKNIGAYDFRNELNVDILGKLFEKSINDIEKVRLTGFFEAKSDKPLPKMAKSAERKKEGVYYTPPEFTEFIAYNTIDKLIDERLKPVAEKHGLDFEDPQKTKDRRKLEQYIKEAIEIIRQVKIVDPACGSGAFLIQAYQVFEEKYLDIAYLIGLYDDNEADKFKDLIPDYILHENVYGVDLSPAAVEIAQLALWLQSAHRGKTLADLSKNIVCGNSLVSDASIHPRALNWQEKFPEVFNRENPGFDCVIGNPPWERLKLQEREFFDSTDSAIASAVNAAKRRQLIEKLQQSNPELNERYQAAKENTDKTLNYVRTCNKYPLTSRGDINTYAVFAELAKNIVSPIGRVGLLVPSGISSDDTTKDFFAELTKNDLLIAIYDFENKLPVFPDVHRAFKFSIFLFGGSQTKCRAADFVFFAHTMEDLNDKKRHIQLSGEDFKLLNPNTRTCPIFRTKLDAELAKGIYRRVPVLIDKSRTKGGNPWEIRFTRMFDQTNDAELFREEKDIKKEGYKLDGNIWKKGKKTLLPLYEAKMIQMYDHRAASVVVDETNWLRQGQTEETSLVQHQNPEYAVQPRWWASSEVISNALGTVNPCALLAFKNVTSPTNQRTMIAALLPTYGVINSAPLIRFSEQITPREQCCFLANLNSFALDYIVRQKIGNVNLNFFLIEQFPIFPPDFYEGKCLWAKKQTIEEWVSERVLKLTCTSDDMIPLAEAAGFTEEVHKWNEAERISLMAELDAAYFIFYGIERKEVEYILSTFSGLRSEKDGMFTPHSTTSQILECYDRFRGGINKA